MYKLTKLKERNENMYRNKHNKQSNIKPNERNCMIKRKLPMIEYFEKDAYDNKKYTNINNDDKTNSKKYM